MQGWPRSSGRAGGRGGVALAVREAETVRLWPRVSPRKCGTGHAGGRGGVLIPSRLWARRWQMLPCKGWLCGKQR